MLWVLNVSNRPPRKPFSDDPREIEMWRIWIANNLDPVQSLSVVNVDNIDDPSAELLTLSAETNGKFIITYEAITGDNEGTLYLWDSQNTLTHDPPFIVQGKEGFWVAVSGKYTSQSVFIKQDNSITFGDGLTDGDWKFMKSTTENALLIQVRVSGAWKDAGAYLPPA